MKEPPHDETKEQLMNSISDLTELSNRILSRIEEVEMSQTSSPTWGSANGFSAEQSQFIFDSMAEIVAMAQAEQDAEDYQHQHGGRAECQGCHTVAIEAMQTARNQGQSDAVTYFNSIPGVTDLRTAYEQAKADALAGQELLTFVD